MKKASKINILQNKQSVNGSDDAEVQSEWEETCVYATQIKILNSKQEFISNNKITELLELKNNTEMCRA